MLRRPFLCTVGALLLASGASAQLGEVQALPPTGVKNAGVYHLATHTWTRGDAHASAWNDVIYDNTCTSGWYAYAFDNRRLVDCGRLPATNSPQIATPTHYTLTSWTGTQDSYLINYFEVGYCTWAVAPVDLALNFWTSLGMCTNSTSFTPTATFALSNMPGGGTAASCWTVGIDLANSGTTFTMQAEGNGTYDDGGLNGDRFGWSFQHVSPHPAGGYGGPLLRGDPLGFLGGGSGGSGCDMGAHTVFYAGTDINNTQGTGLGTQDRFEWDWVVPPSMGACDWFGGYIASGANPYSSFYMQLGADSTYVPSPGIQYCPGDGVPPHTPCPFANNNDGSMGGCDWGSLTFTSGGVLDAVGSDLWSANDAYLQASAVENNFGIFFGANIQVNGGNGNPLNDGLRCAGGGLIRLTPPTMASGNAATLPAPLQTLDVSGGPGVTRRYQYWFRTPGGPGGTSANLTNGYEIAWL